nr:MAG TPA: hypothetical protein [Caudoviricetes sp.]
MATQAQNEWNHPKMLNSATQAEPMSEAETKREVIRLIKQGKGNLYITSALGVSYTEVVSIRTCYEKKAHLSGN